MNWYYDGFDSYADGAGDDNNAGNNAVDGNPRVIASKDMDTYGNHYYDSRSN